MSKKNVWRKIGRNGLECKRESGRYHDGSLDGRDVLWLRSARVKGVRGIAWCDTEYDAPHGKARLGLGIYFPVNSRRDAIAVAKAMLEHVKESRDA